MDNKEHYKDPMSPTSNIRLAVPSDSNDVMQTINACKQKLNADGIDQWDDLYPGEATIRRAIQKGCLYLATEEECIPGGMGFDDDQPFEYEGLSWSTRPPIYIVHHIFVHPDRQLRGIATSLMQFAESLATRDHASIRLDAYVGNAAALALYDSRGYARVGEVFFPRRQLPFICFEKRL